MKASNKQIYALEKLGETARSYGMCDQDRARFDTTSLVKDAHSPEFQGASETCQRSPPP